VAGEVDARSGVSPAVCIPGGPIDVTISRRLALTSGLFYGLLAAAGCSNSSSETSAVKIDGLSPGEYRDKHDADATKGGRGKRKTSKARQK